MSAEQLQVDIAETVAPHAECEAAIHAGVQAMRDAIGQRVDPLLQGVQIRVGSGLTESGGEAFPDQRLIVLDAQKAAMSQRDVEELLVQRGYYEPGDITSLLPDDELDKAWSYTVYNVVHELGHLLEGEVPAGLSPTKYGRKKEGEVIPELLAYYVFGANLSVEARTAIEQILDKNLPVNVPADQTGDGDGARAIS